MMTRKKKEDEKVKSDGEMELQKGKKNFTLEQQWDGEADILFFISPISYPHPRKHISLTPDCGHDEIS